MPALANLVIAVSGTHKGYTHGKLESLIQGNGGIFSKVVDKSTTHLVSTEADANKNAGKVKNANDAGIPVVSLEWLTASIDTGKKVDEASYALNSTPAPPPAPSTRPKRKASQAVVTNDDDDEEDKPPVAKKPKSKAAAVPKSKGKSKAKSEDEAMDDAEDEEEEAPAKAATPPPPAKMKTIVKKGKAPVDDICPLAGTHHVWVDEQGVAWDATLNQTDIGRNNNKFYYCQLLESDSTPHTYSVFCRWGRVGDRGQSKMYEQSTTLYNAKSTFDKQMKAKTGKNWSQRSQAVGGNKKYAYLERNYDEDDEEDDTKGQGASTSKATDEVVKPIPDPTIAPALVKLMELIFNSSFMQQTMLSMSYDSNKLPLGKLSKDTILRGFNVLKTIGEVIGDPTNAVANFSEYGGSLNAILNQLSSRYYTVIPHNFGRMVPPVISTQQALKKEADLVESLIDMKITSEIMNATNKIHDIHPADHQFNSLGLNEAVPLPKTSSEFKHLEAYVKKTHGHTHHIKLEVEEIFRITRPGEEQRWQSSGWDKHPNDNRKLLWHGSRTTNFSGILSQGLRIAPPEAPVTGYMFDKGIYLADIVSKSANYCYPELSANTGLLLLCEAQLGDPMYESVNADCYAASNSKKVGAIATKGLGRTVPLEWEDASIINGNLKGVQIPKVTGSKGNITGDATGSSKLYLQYNEYIVYNVSQVKLRYLFRVKTSRTW